MKARVLFLLAAAVLSLPFAAQLKYVIDDFEGLGSGRDDLQATGLFSFGAVRIREDRSLPMKKNYSGDRALMVEKKGGETFGGWGKGLNQFVELHFQEDYLNFYVHCKTAVKLKIELQEDDNGDHAYQKERDDAWVVSHPLEAAAGWELVSIPISRFRDANSGGDGLFNVNYRHGQVICLIFTLENIGGIRDGTGICFDFLAFSKGPLNGGATMFDGPAALPDDACVLGAWSSEGNTANFTDIASSFERYFGGQKKLGVVHFFQPFSVEGGGGAEYHYPSVDRINKVIAAGYIPMITLEDHFVNVKPGMRQPNLYSIVEGHFDSFLGYWAHHIKQVNGVVLLRILHEFNGDWYPWCTVKNDRDPALVAKAFRYICNVFRENNVTNVRFIWCPNSMSSPQAEWNYIMDAYPGDDYVDFVALDVYNGAGGAALWRSFRKEASENYFQLTEKLPGKPLLICETASRERRGGEGGQSKSEWICQMAEAVKSDMSRIRLLAWFDEKETFKVNSSGSSQGAYRHSVGEDRYFQDGQGVLAPLLRKE